MAGTSTWNPNAGSGRALGLEWFPTTVDSVTLDNENDVLVTSIVCTETKTIDSCYVNFAAVEPNTRVVMDVYENALPSSTVTATDTYTPIALPTINCMRWGFVSNDTMAPVDAVQSTELRDANPNTYHWNRNALHYGDRNFETWIAGAMSASAWTNRRPLWVQILGEVDNVTDDASAQPATWEALMFPNVTFADRSGPYGTEYALQSRVQVFTGWNKLTVQPRRGTDNTNNSGSVLGGTAFDSGVIYSDPYADAPWTVESLFREIAGSSEAPAGDPSGLVNSWGIRVYSSYCPAKAARILGLRINVGYLPVDTRIAWGVTTPLSTGWQEMLVRDPAGAIHGLPGSSWTMTAGKTYYFVLRVVRSLATGKIGTVTIGRLGEAAENAQQIRNGAGSTMLTADNPFGIVTSLAGFLGSSTSDTAVAAVAPFQENTGTVPSNDALVYSDLEYIPTLPSNSLQQEFTPGSNMTLRSVKFIACISRTQTPTADLVVALRRRSDSSLLQQTTLPVAELANPPTSGQIVTVMFANAASLTAGTQYYIEFTSATQGWTIGLLYVDHAPTPLDRASFGGITDRASWAGGDLIGDVAVALYQTPTTPASFTCTEVVTAVDPAATSLHGVQLSWAATSLGARFSHYEIERFDDREGFVLIAALTNEADTAVNDWEHRFGVPVFYRMRVVDNLGIPSSWAPNVSLQVDLTDCQYFFTSNEDPTLNVGGIDTNDGKREWSAVLETEIVPMYGREGSIGFQELERRGDTFELDLLLYNGGTTSPQRLVPAPGGRDAFYPWLQLARARVSYICVRNEKGDRWYSSIDHVDVRIENDALYYAKLSVQQTTWTPSPVDEP